MPRFVLMAKYNEYSFVLVNGPNEEAVKSYTEGEGVENETPAYDYEFVLVDDNNNTVYPDVHKLSVEALTKQGYKEIYVHTKRADKYTRDKSFYVDKLMNDDRDVDKLMNDDRDEVIQQLCLGATQKLLTHAEALIKDYAETHELKGALVQPLFKSIQEIEKALPAHPHPIEIAKKIAQLVIEHKSAALDDGFVSWFFRKMAQFCNQIGMKPAAEFFTNKYAAGITANNLEALAEERIKPKTKR